jgi:hypothetical protein
MMNVPLQRSLTPGRIAQLEERGPYKAEVPGSIPGPPTKKNKIREFIGDFSPRIFSEFFGGVRRWN